jgi:hypothetical protein
MEKIRDSWCEFIENDVPQFPREIGRWVPMKQVDDKKVYNEGYPRFQVDGIEEYLTAIEKYQGVGATTSLYSLPMKENREVNKLFIEIGDSSTIYIAHKMMQGVCRFLNDIYSVDPYVQYTNSKSFHINIGFQAIQLRPTIYKVPEEVLKFLLEGAVGNKYVKEKIVRYLYQGEQIKESSPDMDVDWQVVSDFGRCQRMPYTKHIKSVRSGDTGMVVPIKYKWSLHRILTESKNPCFEVPCTVFPNDNIYRIMKDVEGAFFKMEESTFRDHEYTPVEIGDNRDYKKKIEWLLERAPSIDDGPHRIVMHILLPMLKYSGMSWDQTEIIIGQFLRRMGKEHLGIVHHARNYWWNKISADGKPYVPMRIDTFCNKYPELKGFLV